MALPIIVVPWALLDMDIKVLWLIPLVFFGTIGVELTDVAGSIKTSRYQTTKRRIAVRSRNRYAARWNILWWVIEEYIDAFLKKMPRFLFRITAWWILAAAGAVLTSI